VIRHAEEVMGTVVSFAVRDDGLTDAATRAALQTACETLHDADAVFSTYKPNSPLSRLRRGEITVGDAPPEVGEVLQLCHAALTMSDGSDADCVLRYERAAVVGRRRDDRAGDPRDPDRA
jgi:thiamine biosynthesis lipoprotein